MAKALHRSLFDLLIRPIMIGSFGWICGYSADPFMEEAVQRFTQTAEAAESQGRALALIMDPSCPQITGAAGVLHLPAFESAEIAIGLCIPKVALLLFRFKGWEQKLSYPALEHGQLDHGNNKRKSESTSGVS